MSTAAAPETPVAEPKSNDGIGENDFDSMFDMDVGSYQGNKHKTPDEVAAGVDEIATHFGEGTATKPTTDATAPAKPATEASQLDAKEVPAEEATPLDVESERLSAVRREATQIGLRSEDVQSLDATALANLVEFHKRLMLSGNGPMPQPQVPFPQQQQFMPPPGYGQFPQPQPVQPFDLKLDPAVYDEGMVNQLQALNQHYAQVAQAQQQQLMAIQQQQMIERQQAAIVQQRQRDREDSLSFDSWIEKQGEAFRPIFGGNDIVANGPQHRVRAQVFDVARQLEQQAAAMNTPVDRDWIRQEAARRVLGSQYDYFQQQAKQAPVEKRQSQMLARANGAAPKAARKSGEAAAEDRVEQFFKTRGL